MNENKFLKKKLNHLAKANLQPDGELGREIYSTEYNFTIETTSAIYINSLLENYHSYTFKIERENPEYLLENLILSYNDSLEVYHSYVQTYDITLEELNAINSTEYVDLEGKISLFRIDGAEIVSDFLNKEMVTINEICPIIQYLCGSGDHTAATYDRCSIPDTFYSFQTWVDCSWNLDPNGGVPGGGGGGGSGGGGGTPPQNDYDGSDPDIHGNGGGVTTSPNTGCRGGGCVEFEDPEDEEDPCDKLAENSQNTDFLSNLNYLKDNTNLNQEVGFTRTESITGSPNTSIEFQNLIWVPIYQHLTMNTVSGQLYSDYGHTHYDIENQLSVFSLSDIYTIFTLLDTGHIYDLDFTAYLVTAHGTKYALKFKDLESVQNFVDFGNEWFSDWDMMNMPEEYSKRKAIEDIFKNDYKIKPRNPNNNDKNEENFAKFLSDSSLGMDLYKSNDDFSEWEKVNPDGTTTPCN